MTEEKFNLKNRPQFLCTTIPDQTKTQLLDFCRESLRKYEDWFEGFEKQIRERLDAFQKFSDERVVLTVGSFIGLLKEILGE